MTRSEGGSESDEFYPEFLIVRRGYDPEQVEQVLDDLYATLDQAVRDGQETASALRRAETARHELEDSLARAERRIAELEARSSDPAEPSLENVGGSVTQILHAATAEAAEIRRRAHDEAQTLHDESEAAALTSRVETEHYATDVRTRADEEARTLVTQARAEAERLLTDAQARRESQERAAVEAHHQRIVSLSTRIDALTAELDEAQRRAQVEADEILADAQARARRMVEEARQQRARAHDEVASAHSRIMAALTAAGLPVPERVIPVREPGAVVQEPEDARPRASRGRPTPDPDPRRGDLETPDSDPEMPHSGQRADTVVDEPARAARSSALR
jgi:cell division septum initiation protein DivIVA